jgi:acyl-homoserine-lactone acylase
MKFPRSIVPLFFFLLMSTVSYGQINPEAINIVRHQWGVPHIFAPTDAAVAYGFGWATAEDYFKTRQQQLLPVEGLAGLVFKRADADPGGGFHLIKAEDLVADKHQTNLSEEL